MSWLYSRALAEEYLGENFLDGEQSVPSNTMNTQEMFLSQGKTMEHLNLSRYGMTCGHLTGNRGEELLTLYLEDFRAKTLVRLVQEKDLMAKGLGCGQKCGELLAKYNQDTSSWKTAHCLLFEDLDWYSGAFPRWGMMQDGELWEVMMSDYPPSDSVSGLLPAPMATDWKETGRIERMAKCWEDRNYGHQKRPAMFFAHFYNNTMPPEFEEAMMGWPIGWSDLKELETDKFQQWLGWHGIYSQKDGEE